MEKWFVQQKRADFRSMAEKFGIDPVIARLIRNRDVVGEENISKYLRTDMSDLNNPHELKDIDNAAELIISNKNDRIRIISDYDVDGVMSNYILYTGFKKCGLNVDYKIPHRIKDGYGINKNMIDQAKNDGISLIVTCDNGISALEEIRYAKSIGLNVVVTDHHDIPYEVKDEEKHYLESKADAIVNPKQESCTYTFDKLCGASVALKLIQVLYEKLGFQKSEYEELIPFAAIATICDVVDLVDENRSIAKIGLEKMKETENIGLIELLKANGLYGKKLTSYDFGFVVGACINAAGRLDSADIVMDLLLETNTCKAEKMAADLKYLNEKRKEMTEEGMKKAFEIVEEELMEDDVLVVFLPDCHESLAGIIAGRIRERFYKPAIVLTRGESGVKGSGRSIESYHMFESLNEVKDLLLGFGGHPMAAGLSLKEKNIVKLRKSLNEKSKLSCDDLSKKVMIDMIVPINYISEELVRQLDLLEPVGKCNESPLFADRELKILSARKIGKNSNYLKLVVQDGDGCSMDALMFQNADEFEKELIKKYGYEEVNKMFFWEENNILATFTYYPSINEFRGNKTIQMMIQNYKI